MNRTLFIIRGLPGSGKTTLGQMIAGQYVYAADDFFYEIGQGDYAFDPLRLHEAHAVCRERVREALSQGVAKVAVTNTFTESWEAAPYFELAEEFDYVAFVISCESKFENVHGVPESTIAKMAERWDKSLMKPLQKENEGPLAYDPNRSGLIVGDGLASLRPPGLRWDVQFGLSGS